LSRHNLGLDSCFDDVRVFARDSQLEVVGTKDMAECFVGIQRSWVMARSIGAAQSVMNCAIGYTKDREQLWQSFGNFRFFRFKVPTALSEIEYARHLVYCVRNDIDHGRRCDKKEAVVNYFSAEMSERVTSGQNI
jgi:acyl-CoA dehydrogenase